MKATELYFPVVLFIMPYKVVANFESMDEILLKVWPFKWKLLRCTFLWCCLLCHTRWFQLLSLRMKSFSVTIQKKATEKYFPVVLFIMPYKVVATFESMDEILVKVWPFKWKLLSTVSSGAKNKQNGMNQQHCLFSSAMLVFKKNCIPYQLFLSQKLLFHLFLLL